MMLHDDDDDDDDPCGRPVIRCRPLTFESLEQDPRILEGAIEAKNGGIDTETIGIWRYCTWRKSPEFQQQP
jgi:hypothetical protein